jgi:hypothetical protein
VGYTVTPRVCVIRLRGTEFDGVDVRADVPPSGEMSQAAMRGDLAIARLLATNLVSWNLLDEDGEPIDCTSDGLDSLPTDLVVSLAAGYWRSCTRVQRDRPTPPADEMMNGASAGTEIAAL